MGDVIVTAPQYLLAPCDGLWTWRDRGATVVWIEATSDWLEHSESAPEETFAFAPQLQTILKQVHDRLGSIPSLGVVLLTIDACRDIWNEVATAKRLRHIIRGSRARSNQKQREEQRLAEVLEWLRKINRLPPRLRKHPDAVAVILESALRGARSYFLEPVADAIDVLQTMGLIVSESDHLLLFPDSVTHSVAGCKRLWESLLQLSTVAIDADRLDALVRTGIADLPTPVTVESITVTPSVGALLQDLREDRELGEMMAWAITAANMLSLPRRPSDPDQLPSGGISDITNRGHPERLLMTELAQPSFLLLARIANGQALYVRHESPPAPTPHFRPILMESSIRTWGRIRVRIAAMALGVAAIEERRGQKTARWFTVDHQGWHEETLHHREGILQHLERLSPGDQPGDAIKRWSDDWPKTDQTDFAEPIVVVSQATDRDPLFRAALATLSPETIVVRIEPDDRISLLRHRVGGEEILQTLSIRPVEKTTKRLPDGSHAAMSSLDLHWSRMPLGFPVPTKLRFANQSRDGSMFVVTDDDRLLWFNGKSGCKELLWSVPTAPILAYQEQSGILSLVFGDRSSPHQLLEINPYQNTTSQTRIAMEPGADCQYSFDRGDLFRYRKGIELINQKTGEIMDDHIREAVPLGGPLVWRNGDYHIVAAEAGQVVLHKVMEARWPAVTAGLAVRLEDGEIAYIHSNLKSYSIFRQPFETHDLQWNGPTSTSLHRPKVVHVHDKQVFIRESVFDKQGYSLMGDTPHALKGVNVSLKIGSAWTVGYTNPYQLVVARNRNYRESTQRLPLLCTINGVGFADGQLYLLAKKGRAWRLECDPHMKLKQVNRPSQTVVLSHPYRHSEGDVRSTWTMRKGQVGKISVYADSRGLLHLHNQTKDEYMSLMVSTEHVGGWTSWGEVFGDKFQTGDVETLPSPLVSKWLKELVEECSRSM